MSESHTNTFSPAMGTTMAHAGIPGATEAAGRGIAILRRLVVINLGFAALQPISAGLFLSGNGRAVAFHAAVALALQLGVLIQAVTALVLWRRGRVPARMAGASIGLFVMVLLEVGLGYSKQFWLHVPIGVGIFGGLIRQVSTLQHEGSTRRFNTEVQHEGSARRVNT